MEDIKNPKEKETKKDDVILNETEDDILGFLDTMSVGDMISGYVDNMPDDQIDSEIRLMSRIGRYLGVRNYDNVRVFVDTDNEYDPFYMPFTTEVDSKTVRSKDGTFAPKGGFVKYTTDDGIKVAKDIMNGNTFLYFANDEDFENYIKKAKAYFAQDESVKKEDISKGSNDKLYQLANEIATTWEEYDYYDFYDSFEDIDEGIETIYDGLLNHRNELISGLEERVADEQNGLEMYPDDSEHYQGWIDRFTALIDKVKALDESVKQEDVVKKSNGKWTNRGKDGKEHGEFDTKKKAMAQMKAMYANGYKGESLELKTEKFNAKNNTRAYLNKDKTEDIAGHKRCFIDLVPGTKAKKRFDSKTHKITDESVDDWFVDAKDVRSTQKSSDVFYEPVWKKDTFSGRDYDNLEDAVIDAYVNGYDGITKCTMSYDIDGVPTSKDEHIPLEQAQAEVGISDVDVITFRSMEEQEAFGQGHPDYELGMSEHLPVAYKVMYSTTESLDLKTEDVNPQEKVVIYKSLGDYYTTPESNYGKRISNARATHKMTGFNSANEIIDYYIKYGWADSKDDFIVIDESTERARKRMNDESLQLKEESADNKGKIEVGMIVRYAPGWCSPGERKYLHVVKENLLNPVTNKMTRWLIQTINSKLSLPPTEVVDEEMIEPTGFSIFDFDSPEEAVAELEYKGESLKLKTQNISFRKGNESAKRPVKEEIGSIMGSKEEIVVQRKGYGKVIKITNRYFGDWKYVLLDDDGNFIEDSYDGNKLIQKLYQSKRPVKEEISLELKIEDEPTTTDETIADTVLKNINKDNPLDIKFDLVNIQNDNDCYTMDIISKDKVYFYTATTVSDSKLADDYITSLTDNLKHQMSADALTGNEPVEKETSETKPEQVNESVELKEDTNDKVDTLINQLYDKFYETAKSTPWGFDTDDEVKDYLDPHIEYKPVTDNPEFNYSVEVRFETPTYDAQRTMGEELDKVLADNGYSESYFDDEAYGIMSAYIKVD